MDRKPHKHAELLRALADGYEIQFLNVRNEWAELAIMMPTSVLDDELHGLLQWRIKPEPKPDVVFYLNAALSQAKSGEIYATTIRRTCDNLKLTFDGETGKLKSAEVINND